NRHRRSMQQDGVLSPTGSPAAAKTCAARSSLCWSRSPTRAAGRSGSASAAGEPAEQAVHQRMGRRKMAFGVADDRRLVLNPACWHELGAAVVDDRAQAVGGHFEVELQPDRALAELEGL